MPNSGRRLGLVAIGGVVAMSYAALAADGPRRAVAEPLKSPSDFASIADRNSRSVALFREAARVLTSPRCLNCHPSTRIPTQGQDLHPHVPYLQAGVGGHGLPGLDCKACHQSENVMTQGASIPAIPGNGHWALAPASMAWQGLTVGEICRQVKDPARNGGRSLERIREHMATDSLVGWAWDPGPGRAPAPGTWGGFAKLVEAWIETGAACPSEDPVARSSSRRK